MTVTFDSSNPVVGETGKNITMQWSINEANRSSVKFIFATYSQVESSNEELIVGWGTGGPVVSMGGQKYFKNRLITNLDDNNKFMLVITNAKYEDRGIYFMEVQLTTKEDASSTVTLNVHGMFFSYF